VPGLTRLELRTRVQNLGYGTDVATAINDAISDAQNRVLAIRRWPFLETTTEQVIVADTSEVLLSSFPLVMDRVDAARLYDGDTELDMRWVHPEEFRRREWLLQDEAIGPFFWTRYAETIRLGPATDKSYTLVLEGMKHATVLDDDADQTDIPLAYSGVLTWGAVEHLAYRHRDWAARQVAEEMFAKHLNAMLTAYVHDQRQGDSEVARWDGWDDVAGGRLIWRA